MDEHPIITQPQDAAVTVLPVDRERLLDFDGILQKYKAGKKRTESRVVAAENWWKLRNGTEAQKQGVGWSQDFRAKSGWLHNVIVSKHADATENYPEPIILPREPGDADQAKLLSDVLPVVLEQAGFEQTYSDAAWQKLKTGTGVYKVTWDADKLNGLGDISIEHVDLLSVFWEPGVEDIQQSRYFFHVELQDNEVLESQYPQLKDKLKGNKTTLTRFLYDDTVPTDGKSAVIDVYYRRREGTRTVLHYCKYVNDQVLASTENEAAQTGGFSRGLYDHGEYPFVFDVLWPIEGSPCGYGYVDLCSNTQIQIDLLDTAFLKNAMVGATPRYFHRAGSTINQEQFKDLGQPIVEVTGSLDDTGIRPIEYNGLAGNYINLYQQKIQEMRETSGNTESSNGVTTGGVTAASAIAALQEASGKTSRDATRASYRSFERVISMCIELVRQFYDLPRMFRIQGPQGAQTFVSIDNSAMLPQPLGVGAVDMGYRLPVYDIKIKAQRRNAFSRASQNELALQLYNLGFFDPQLCTQALACLQMMDFEGKDELMQRLAENAAIWAQAMSAGQGPPPAGGGATMPTTDAQEPGTTRRARERTSSTTAAEG